MDFKTWLETVVFQTAKGSTYKFHNGLTQRFKAPHQFHPSADVGLKEISEKTIFVDEESATRIGWWGVTNAKIRKFVLYDGRFYLLSQHGNSERLGIDKVNDNNTFTLTPQIGLCPVELWKKDNTPYEWLKPGMEVYGNTHPGTPITKIGDVPFGQS